MSLSPVVRTHLNAEPPDTRWCFGNHHGDRILHLFPLATLFPFQRCQAISIRVLYLWWRGGSHVFMPFTAQ